MRLTRSHNLMLKKWKFESQSDLTHYGIEPLRYTKKRRVINMERKELPKIDFTQYVGTKTEVDKAEIIETRYGLALKLTSKPLDEKVDVRASSLYSFNKDDDGSYFIGVGTKLDNFLKTKKLDEEFIPEHIEKDMEVPMLRETPVVVQMNSKTGYLELV